MEQWGWGLVVWALALGGCRCSPEMGDSPNVRTVLFRRSDLSRECWTREEMSLLFTRRMMQELVPRRVPRNASLLLDYFKSCLETVKEMAPSRRTHALVLSALADTLGGYLQAYGLPLTNEAYYEGSVGYSVAKQLHELEEAFKKTLRTDGGGWTRPMVAPRSASVQPLSTPRRLPSNPCRNLINNVSPDKGCEEGGEEGRMRIGVPFLDDARNPSALAVPFKDRSLFSLSSKSSADALPRYYEEGLACLIKETGASSLSVRDFLDNLSCWLEKSVVPHLHDETWYPGFGGVLRIVETIKTTGGRVQTGGSKISKCKEERVQTSALFYVAIVAAVLLAFWVIVLCVYVMYRLCSKKKDDNSSCSSSSLSSPVLSTLVSLYCGGKDNFEKGGTSKSSPSRLKKRKSSQKKMPRSKKEGKH